MNLTNCPLCGEPAFDLHLTPSGKCADCSKVLARGEAIRDVAGLWDRATRIEDECDVAYVVIAGSVANMHAPLMCSVVETAKLYASSLRRQAEKVMAEHGVTDQDMIDYANTQAEIAVAHYDPTPMLPYRY